MKRLFDVLISLLILMAALPVMLFVAILIKLESKGPVLFKQERVGLNGRLFNMYKYRSMVINAEKQGPYYTSANDPRITKVGRFIRKTSLDELPQLLNVLVGDMSLVGPRPNVSQQRKDYTEEEWAKRNSVRPGITGLAQAKLRSMAKAGERTRLDLEYVDKASVLFDMWVLMLTVKQLFITRGSN